MKFSRVFQLLVACAFFQLCWLNHTNAQSSPALNIQGVLRNSINGAAVDNGVYKIKFSLYTVGGDSVERDEMVIASSSDTIYAFINGTNYGNYGSVGISDVEIWVR